MAMVSTLLIAVRMTAEVVATHVTEPRDESLRQAELRSEQRVIECTFGCPCNLPCDQKMEAKGMNLTKQCRHYCVDINCTLHMVATITTQDEVRDT